MLARRLRAAGFGLALSLALSCGSGGPAPGPTTPASSAPPRLAGPPAAAACPLGKGALEVDCSRRTPTELLSQVETAIDLVAQRPAGILDLTQENPPQGSGQYRGLDGEGVPSTPPGAVLYGGAV